MKTREREGKREGGRGKEEEEGKGETRYCHEIANGILQMTFLKIRSNYDKTSKKYQLSWTNQLSRILALGQF